MSLSLVIFCMELVLLLLQTISYISSLFHSIFLLVLFIEKPRWYRKVHKDEYHYRRKVDLMICSCGSLSSPLSIFVGQ